MRQKTVSVIAGLVFALASVQPVAAHKVIASVFASGSVIEGEVGFSNGDMARDTLVEVFDGQGNKLGETKTDEDGFFTFTPTSRVVHVFKANLGAGHVAEVRMALEDLPRVTEAGRGAAPGVSDDASKSPGAGSVPVAESANGAARDAALLQENRELLREMIHKEVTPLRREIAAYKEKNDLQTILGGMGYIAGLFGLFFYVAARRKMAAR